MPTIVKKIEGPHYLDIIELFCPLCKERLQVNGMGETAIEEARDLGVRHNKGAHGGNGENIIVISWKAYDRIQATS